MHAYGSYRFKAYMKSYITLETAAISKTAQTENYKMKNSCPQWDLNPGYSAYEANALSVELLELISIDHLMVTVFYMYLSVLLIVALTEKWVFWRTAAASLPQTLR